MMKQLDSDDAFLRDDAGRQAFRDIVQFVKFKKFTTLGVEALSAEVLKELPDQIVEYLLSKNIMP